MKLNSIEKALMNNPIRASLQRYYEAPLLQRLGGRLDGQRVLEIGCGRGIGTQLLVEHFGAREVTAFDLDPDMVARAKHRLRAYIPNQVHLYVGDATQITAEDASFDAVVDFGIIHHIPNWQDAVAEIYRVLKPGGLFFFEEVTRQALNRWFYTTFLEHPTSNRFSGEEFVAELERQGIRVSNRTVERFFGDFIIGVGSRQ